MNFEYSPGLFGYGIRGDDGSAGIPGASLYFTNYDRDQDEVAINACISEDRVMWLGADPNTKLSDGRTYKYGDLFIDKDGWLCEINQTLNGYVKTDVRLNSLSLFEDASVISQNGYERYHNIDDPSERYIIDNIYSDEGVYPSLPTLYGINPKNYARIEYSDVVDLLTSRNAFTLYSSAEIPFEDNPKAFCLVRDTQNNIFRIGNIDANDNIRTTTLIFDFVSLIKNSSTFTINTPLTEVLTNMEIDANGIFGDDGNPFDSSGGFSATSPSSATINVSWDLNNITPDTNVNGRLYFYETSTGENFYYTPLILPIESNGNVTLTGVKTGYDYKYYIEINKNGWCRNTVVKTIRAT